MDDESKTVILARYSISLVALTGLAIISMQIGIPKNSWLLLVIYLAAWMFFGGTVIRYFFVLRK